MRNSPHPVIRATPDSEPSVDQGEIYGFTCTWNPDDSKFYLTYENGETIIAYKDKRNVVQAARKMSQGLHHRNGEPPDGFRRRPRRPSPLPEGGGE